MSKNILAVTHNANLHGYINFLKILPIIILNVKNWLQFLQTYKDQYKGEILFRDGFKLFVDDSSDISSISTSFFRKDYGNMDPNWKTIVDIGAHKGFFTTYVARNCPHALIYSYEPIKSSFEALEKNVQVNNLNNRVKTFNLGVASESGEREINLSTSSTDNSFYAEIGSIMTGKEIITCTTLDQIINQNHIEKIDLLKLDCEGAEFEVLMASNKEVLLCVSEIRMEYHNINPEKNIVQLQTFLENTGFRLLNQNKSTNPNIGYVRFAQVQ